MQKEKVLLRHGECSKLHLETFVTMEYPDFAELIGQEIHSYSVLLLYTNDEWFTDVRPVFEATGREWRPRPLWGIGYVKPVNQHANFLHDGRARNVKEAIFWHGG